MSHETSDSRKQLKMPTANTKARGRIQIAAIVVLGTILVWGVVSRTFVASLVESNPELTKYLAPSSPYFEIFRADRAHEQLQAKAVSNAGSQGSANDKSGDLPKYSATGSLVNESGNPVVELSASEIRRLATSALAGEPMLARGLSILGFIADANGQQDLADRFMKAAAQRSHREVSAVYWTFRRSFETKKFGDATSFGDALLRKKPQMMTVAAPILGRMAEDPDAVDFVTKLLARDPPWRRQFFATLKGNFTDARTPLKLMLGLNETSAPPTRDELNAYFNFLMGHGFHELAYSSWLQFLTPDQLAKAALVYNGSFEQPLSFGVPFDWNIPRQAGATVEIASRDDKDAQQALAVEFNGARAAFQPVWQITMLSAGQYTISGVSKGDIKGKRGLVWQLRCAGPSSALAGEGAMTFGSTSTWTPFEFTAAIPENNCRAQKIDIVVGVEVRIRNDGAWKNMVR